MANDRGGHGRVSDSPIARVELAAAAAPGLFFLVIRNLCRRYIAAVLPYDSSIDTRELFSEVIAKLLGVSGIGMAHDPGADSGEEAPTMWAISDNPKRDERVVWLIDQVGGQQALKHRYEDIRRRLNGGKWRGNGYRQVQLEMAHIEGLSVEPDDPHHEDDVRNVWRGLLAMAVSEFEPGADVLLLLDLMAHDHDVQAGFGKEWPVGQMVSASNLKHPIPPWNDDRVENAKKRLKNWIVRLKRIRCLDASDLMDLFARRGREEGQN